MTSPVMPGAEAYAAAGGPAGVLVLHGFTGNPFSMRGVARRLADAGLTVELPRLPGHGTSLEDLVPLRWDDWANAAEDAYRELATRCTQIAVVGMSMGGTLACWLAARHPEIRGLALVNPAVQPPAEELQALARELLASGTEIAPSIGSDIADPEAVELSYDGTPVAALLSLIDTLAEVSLLLGDIRCPVLLLSSREDHVVSPSDGDRVVASVKGPCERVWLERSYHVATLDYDRHEVEERTVAFVRAVISTEDGATDVQADGGPDVRVDDGTPGEMGGAAPAADDRSGRSEPPSLGRDEVAHVASLARLALTDEELERYTGQLAKVIEHARDVAALDLSGVAPTAHPFPIRNVLRPDEEIPCLDRAVVLAEAPAAEDGRFRVPRIVGEAP